MSFPGFDRSYKVKQANDDNILLSYASTHAGHKLRSEDIELIDQSLLCKMWACEKTPTNKELFDPESSIVFFKSANIVSYVGICSKSGIVDCKPDSDNKELSIFQNLINRMFK